MKFDQELRCTSRYRPRGCQERPRVAHKLCSSVDDLMEKLSADASIDAVRSSQHYALGAIRTSQNCRSEIPKTGLGGLKIDPRRVQNRPLSALGGSRSLPEASETHPRAPKSTPRARQERPKISQERPRTPRERPKSPQERLKSAQVGPRSPHKTPRTALGTILRRPNSKKVAFASDLLRDSRKKRFGNDSSSIFHLCAKAWNLISTRP